LWFEAIGTFTNDLRVPGFLASVAMDGNVLHDIPDFAWIESLLINSNYNPNGNNKVWFAEDIVVNLAKVNAFSSPQTVAITKVGLVRVLR
tara:strand:+ start:252 stop:521 length:270 start_codon:yes stop_codon:yes gene_type:complete